MMELERAAFAARAVAAPASGAPWPGSTDERAWNTDGVPAPAHAHMHDTGASVDVALAPVLHDDAQPADDAALGAG
ncbi:MAG TPA: hypothetical protein VFG03_18945, partial [Telluria sp.]|nr:hypothetical protein [Telluria sp.]